MTNEQRWMAYIGLSHMYLYCDTLAEQLAKNESYSEDQQKNKLEHKGRKFVKFILKEQIDFKNKNMFEQIEKKWNDREHSFVCW